MSNLSDFLKENGIAPEAVVQRSAALEKASFEDRAALTKREDARRNKKSYAEVEAAKPGTLGRGVSMRTLGEAMSGQPVPRTGRKKITRAVGSLLQSQKKDAVDFRVLFGDVGAKKGKKAK